MHTIIASTGKHFNHIIIYTSLSFKVKHSVGSSSKRHNALTRDSTSCYQMQSC